ncbi:MAG: NUDIX hydrolase [Microthrixaceae bacterium]
MAAAGGAVWRSAADGCVEVVVVHRPRYDDWSLPKGKTERDETAEQTALREVEEETGLRCRLGSELVTVRYETAKGEDKTVRWWAMTVEEDLGFVPGEEVDELRWVPLDAVEQLVTFDSDRDVVHSLDISGELPERG